MVSFAMPAGLHSFRLAFSQSAHCAPFPACLRSSAPRFARRYLSSKQSPQGSPKPVGSSPSSSKLPIREFKRSPQRSRSAKKAPLSKLERRLANAKGGAVLLFQAPSHRSYRIGIYTTVALSFAYAGYNGYAHCFNPPNHIALWVRALFGGISLISAWAGTVFLLRGKNLISDIRAVRVNDQMQLLFKVRGARPFAKSREIAAKPSEISMSQKVVGPAAIKSDANWTELRAQLNAHKQAKAASFWRSPIQKTSFILWTFFANQRRMFTREHFVYITVRDGEVLKLDLLGTISPEFETLSSDTAYELGYRDGLNQTYPSHDT